MRLAGGKSIVFRLTLLFAALSTAVLLLLGYLIGAAVERHFVEQDMDVLGGKLEFTRQILARMHSREEFDAIPQQLDSALSGQRGLSLVVVAAGRAPLFASSGADYPYPLLARPPQAAGAPPLVWTSPRQQPLRGISRQVESGIAGEAPLIVAVATDISHHEHFMAAFRTTLWTFVGLAALVTGLLGWLAARRGLAPLQAIQREAAGVTARRLHTRIALDAIPVELSAVAVSLNAMLARLEDSFRRLSDFSSDLAHELRTPVSNLLTQTQVTLSKARSADAYREILSSNAEELERMARMIADMLFLAKADHGQIVAAREIVDLAAETRDLFDFYEALAAEKQLRLTLSGAGSVSGDRLMLRRAVSNLLSNALRHTPPQGRIAVRIGSGGDGSVQLAVSNSGTPIAAEHLPRLFDRFYRADTSRQHSGEGAGLGLAIAQSIVTAHSGEIVVAAGDGENTFTLRLPSLPVPPTSA